MTDQEIIRLLFDTGHVNYPFGKVADLQWRTDQLHDLSCHMPSVTMAIRSWQDFLAPTIEPISMSCNGRIAMADGILGPAGREVLKMPRCGCPDYGCEHDHFGEVGQPVLGTGNWPKCHGIGDEYHAATVKIYESGMPSFLRPVFNEVWKRTVAAYEQIGLRFIRTEDDDANIEFSFVNRSSGWIGLAIVGRNKFCDSQIWCKYLSRYEPRDVLGNWVTLLCHELGHNAGLNHSRGGIMNPVLTSGLAASWKGDPSHSILSRYYGGEPIPDGPDGLEYWVEQVMRSNRGREVSAPLIPPILINEGMEEIYR